MGQYFFTNNIPISYVKSVKESNIFDQNFHMYFGSWVTTKNMSKRKFSTLFLRPRKKNQQQHENEAKLKSLCMIIFGISFIYWQIFTCLASLVLSINSNIAMLLPVSLYLKFDDVTNRNWLAPGIGSAVAPPPPKKTPQSKK